MGLRLGTAFPSILRKTFPVVEPDFPLITVMYLLQIQDLPAVPLTSDTGENRAVFGFSVLERLVMMGQKRFAAFVQGPCRNASEPLDSFTVDQDIHELLDYFKSKRLAFAAVRGSKSYQKPTMISLTDVLNLYDRGLVKTDITAEDVASPVFSMPANTPIREALLAMFKRKYRQIFVAGEGCYVSDRSIIDYVLSPTGIDSILYESDKDPLSTPIGKLWSIAPAEVGRQMSLHEAAVTLQEKRSGCLMVEGAGVVTPWDLVMKPWLSGKLIIADERKGMVSGRPRVRSRRQTSKQSNR